MKKIICEMCDSSEFLKQDGMFVCQGCGMKYSVEEAKKMMQEEDDAPNGSRERKGNAQIDNLLKLAQSSYDSQNNEQAENFCNQVIALDAMNYEAWQIKGQAIFFQITNTNDRFQEAWNCLLTAYGCLDDEQKDVEKYVVVNILKVFAENYFDFWLKRFEADRPTDAALNKAKNSYVDAYNKIAAAYEEMGFEDIKEEYLTSFDNAFVGACNAICNSAWETTVGYNYYRDYLGDSKDPFGRSDKRWVINNTDLYRPTKNIWDTFLNEADNLIYLLQFAEDQFNDDTDPDVMEAIYSNIAFFEECIIPSGSWKIEQGYTSNWDQYKTVGWHEEYSLTDEAKSIRNKIAAEYRKKSKDVPKKVKAIQKAKAEKEKQERIDKYWEDHADEKAKLDAEQQELQEKMEELEKQIKEIEKKNAPRIKNLTNERDKKLPCEEDVENQKKVILELEIQRDRCGIFKGKEKKALQSRIDTEEKPKLNELEKRAETEKIKHTAALDTQIKDIKAEDKELRDEYASLKKRSDAIKKELTKER